MKRRVLLNAMLGLAVAGPVCAQDRSLPPAVQRALRGYGGRSVRSVRLRRGAPTPSGTMYEVTLGGGSGRLTIFVDPDNGRVLYESERPG